MQEILKCAQRARAGAVVLAIASAAALSGCSTPSWLHIGSDEEAYDYRKAKPRQEPLEVPPDLSQLPKDERYTLPSGTGAGAAKPGEAAAAPTSAAAAPAQVASAPMPAASVGAAVVPTVVAARVVHDGNQRWLAVDASPEVAYATVKDLWAGMGFKIKVDEPRVGIIETEWSEQHPQIPEDFIRNSLHKVLGAFDSNGERIKYRATVERTEKNTAEVTISERGMEEIFSGPLRETTKWQAVPSRPELEEEMLQRLALRFAQPVQVGVAPAPSAPAPSAAGASAPAAAPAIQQAAAPSRVHKVTVDGVATLQVEDSVDRTWRRVGIALDRGGFTIEERQRDKSMYSVRYLDPEYEASEREKKSWWDRLFNADAKIPEQQFRIVLSANGAMTAIAIQDRDGRPDSGPTAGRILDQIMEQLR